jgi:hypothetical protein
MEPAPFVASGSGGRRFDVEQWAAFSRMRFVADLSIKEIAPPAGRVLPVRPLAGIAGDRLASA